MSSSQKGKLHFLVTGCALGTTSLVGICFSDTWSARFPTFAQVWSLGRYQDLGVGSYPGLYLTS